MSEVHGFIFFMEGKTLSSILEVEQFINRGTEAPALLHFFGERLPQPQVFRHVLLKRRRQFLSRIL